MRAGALPIVCAWCERVRTSAGAWEKEEGAGAPGFEATHGICPECLADAQLAASVDAALPAAVIRADARPLP